MKRWPSSGKTCYLLAIVGLGLALGQGCDSEEKPEDTVQDRADQKSGDGQVELDVVVSPDGTQDVTGGQDTSQRLEQPVAASAAFLERKATYLQSCSDASGPGQGGLYGQVCRIVTGQTEYNTDKIDEGLLKMTQRQDTADFTLAAFVRMLYLDKGANVVPAELKQEIETTLLGFRYWLSEPGDDKMCYWTENHQILFHSGELLMGQMYRDQVFSNSGMTGAEHVAHAEPLILRWLDFRGHIGFSEWHSNVYFNEDFPALLNLADFAENEEIRGKARMVVDVLLVDILANTYKGYFATTHGRTYSNKYLGGLKDSTSPMVWLAAGVGTTQDFGNFSAAFLATSSHYFPPDLLEEWAAAIAPFSEHRQRDSLNVEEGPQWGVGYTGHDDVIFWAGASAILSPAVVVGFVAFLNEYKLWDGFLVGDIEEPYKGMIQKMGDDPDSLIDLSTELGPVSRGLGLEQINTYTYRTPDYQLSGAQDYKPGLWSAQTLSWLATLDGSAFVMTTLPANPSMMGGDFGDEWVGGWQPRVTLHRSVGVIQYKTQEVKLFGEAFNTEYTHAFFPGNGFDEVVEVTPWVCGRKGDGYLCLGSKYPTIWNSANEFELTAESHESVWVVQMGRKADAGDFSTFVKQVTEATLSFDEGVTQFDSPYEGQVVVGWEGPMTVDGQAVDLGPYERMEGPQVQQKWKEGLLRVQSGKRTLELDFDGGTRSVWLEQ